MTLDARPAGTVIWVYSGNTFTADFAFPTGYLSGRTMVAELVDDSGNPVAGTLDYSSDGDVLTVTLDPTQTVAVTASAARLHLIDNTGGAGQVLVACTVIGSTNHATATSVPIPLVADDGDTTFPVTVTAVGARGPAGAGVPTGGTTGQALVKTDSSDYATGWHTLTASDVAADPSGAAASAVAAHVAATDPHGDRAYTDTVAATKASTAALTTEASTARAAESANASAIAAEANTARVAEAANATAIADEITRATGVEATKADLVGGKVPSSQIPAMAVDALYVVNSQAAMLALAANPGDFAKRTDLAPAETFMLTAAPASTLANWVPITTGGAVASVNGQVGTVVLAAADVGADTAGAAATVQTNLTTEATTARAAESANATAITNEAATARAAEALAALKANNLSDLASASTARTNLGLGTAATHAASDFDSSGAAAVVQSNLTAEAATARAAESANATAITNEAATARAAEATKAQGLVPTGPKTANYTAAAADLVLTDTTSGAVQVTLPTAPPDKTRVAVKMVVQGGTNVTTYVCGGSDVLNRSGGPTSGTLTLLSQAVQLQYQATGAIWIVSADDLPLGQTDLRYAKLASNLSDLASASTARTNLGLGTSATNDKVAAGSTGVLDATDPTTTNTRTPTDGSVTAAKMAQDVITSHPVSYASTTNIATLSGSQTVDGTATATGDVVLLTGQTTASQNGPWVANSGAWTRPAYWPAAGTISAAHEFTVRAGSSRPARKFVVTTALPITVDTTSVTLSNLTAQAVATSLLTPANSASGIGFVHQARAVATSNVSSLSGTTTIDGVSLVAGDRVLLVAQTTGSQNGPWNVAAGAWTRPTDWPAGQSTPTNASNIWVIAAGTLFAGSEWAISTTGSMVVDTTAPTFVQTGSNNLPWLIDIDPFMTAISAVGTWTNLTAASTLHGGYHYNSSSAQNDAISFDVVLAAGTWTLEVLGVTAAAAAISSVTLGGTSVGTIDWYSAGTVLNVQKSLTGITVATTGKYRLTFTASTRNASNTTGWQQLFQHLQLRRTA